MLFTPVQARGIMSGRKTQHRLLVMQSQTVRRPGPRGIERTGHSAMVTREPFRPVAGRVYPVATPTDTLGACIITAEPVIQCLGMITPAEATKEGFKGRVDLFKMAWARLYGSRVTDLDDDELIARFDRYWADRDVWVITLAPHEPKPTFMCRATQSSGDFTTSYAKAIDPLEVIDPETLQAAREAAHRDRLADRASSRRRAAHRRFERARLVAEANGHDTTQAVRRVQRAAQSLERAVTDAGLDATG